MLWSLRTESNRRPLPYQGSALPTELRRHKCTLAGTFAFPQTLCQTTLHLKKVPTLYHTLVRGSSIFFLRGDGAYERNRTGDLFLTKEVLYLLSYVGAKLGRRIANRRSRVKEKVRLAFNHRHRRAFSTSIINAHIRLYTRTRTRALRAHVRAYARALTWFGADHGVVRGRSRRGPGSITAWSGVSHGVVSL